MPNIVFDKYKQPTPPKIYIGTPHNKKICTLTGIDESSFSMEEKLNNSYEVTFNIASTLNVLSNTERNKKNQSFAMIGMFMRLYIENYGWFIIDPPEWENDGNKEEYSITAHSADIEFQQHNLHNFKVNQGTTDSYEMLVDGNVQMIGDVEFAKEQIKFHNSKNPKLSFLNILLDNLYMTDWTVGYVDSVPKKYTYFEDGVRKEKSVLLADEIGVFDVDSKDGYSFLTQDVSKFFQCIFVFDFENLTINAYRPENLGKSTNININFRNFQKSNNATINDSNIFTRYYVQGSDDLGIEYVNPFGNYIENIDYFLNRKYLSSSTIIKYKLWKSDVDYYRNSYIECTRLYNKQYSQISELKNRVPLDDCSTDWSTFGDDKLQEAQENYKAQLKGYESYYVDENGDFDEEALKKSVDADDYYQIKNVILPSIQIEMDNRNLSSGQESTDYIDSYKTNWKLYGLDELDNKLAWYRKQKKLAEDEGCNIPYNDQSKHTENYHNKLYNKYTDAVNQLNPDYQGSCMEYYNKIKSEIDELTKLQDSYDKERKEIVKKLTKETWVHDIVTDSDGYIVDEVGNYITDENNNKIAYSITKCRFTYDEIAELNKIYIDGDYSNDNMFLTSSDDSISAIDEQLKLLEAAEDDLYITSQPQYTYTTSLDNFLSLYKFKDYSSSLNIGDYLYLSLNENNFVKLRVISIKYNPLSFDNDLQITFSNMIQSKSGRWDTTDLLSNGSSSSKSSSVGSSSSNSYLNNEGVSLTPALIQKLVQSGAFQNQLNNIINNNFGSYIGGSISVNELNAKMIKATDIVGKNGFFEYIQSKLITTDKIIADSATFKSMTTNVASIKNAIIGMSATETGITINLTAENATISEALIKSLMSEYITVNDLKAGNIITDKINVLSQDGKLKIAGNTITVYDDKNNPVIQLGQDKNGNYGLVISDSKGAILLDSQGLHEGIVPDDFIKTVMIEDGAVTNDKIDKKNIREWVDTEGNKVFDVGKMYFGNDKFITSYTTLQNDLKQLKETAGSLTSNYNVILQNETQGIPCTSDGKVMIDFLITIPFSAYEGINQVPCHIEVTNLPSGITLGENTDSTDSTNGQIVLNVAKDNDLGGDINGNAVLTCTVTGINGTQEITKKFSWFKNLQGSDGKDGKTPVKGVDYFDGTSSYLWIKYASDETGSDMTSTPSATSKYIGTASTQTPTAPTGAKSYKWSKYVGENGTPGENGYIHIAYADSADGRTGFDKTVGTGKKYIGQYTDNIETDSDDPTKYTWTLIKGSDGKDAEFYTLESSVDSLKKCTIETAYIVDELGNYIVDENDNLLYGYSYSDEITPKTITFTAYKQVGNKDRVLYPCRFVVYESQDGISYSPKYTSSKDESSITYSPTTTDLHHIKCILCKAGGISDQLDTQTIPVLHDFEGYDNAIRSLEERFSSVAFEIDNAEKSISQKATQEDINRTLSDYDGSVVEEIRKTEAETKVEVDKITNRVSETETEVKKKADGSVVTKLTDRVTEVEQTSSKWQATATENSEKIGELKVRADKVEQRVTDNEGSIASLTTKTDEISSTVSGMTVGGTNLIRNSNDLIFALYYFVADIIDENGNTLIDETGNTLVAYY